MDDDAPASLPRVAVDLVSPEAGRDVPDVTERNTGELAAPAHGDGDATNRCQDDVAERFP